MKSSAYVFIAIPTFFADFQFQGSLILNPRFRFSLALCGVAALGILTGCQPEKKSVAVVNGKLILEEDFNKRVQSLTAASFQGGASMDAGGLTLMNMIRSELTEQLAAKSNAVPSSELVSSGVDYVMKNDPAVQAQFQTGQVTKDELLRQLTFTRELLGIGTNGAKVTDAELKAAYEGPDMGPTIIVKASYSFRALRVNDLAQGKTILEDLKKTGDFKKAAMSLKASEAQANAVAKPLTMISDTVPKELKEALDKLQPNEFTPGAIKVTDVNQQGVPQESYAIAQLIKKDPERKPSINEVKFLLENALMAKKNPEWEKHYRNVLAEFTNAAEIKITSERYKSLGELIKAQAKGELQTPVAPRAAPANIMGGGGGAPAQPQPGSAIAPPSGAAK